MCIYIHTHTYTDTSPPRGTLCRENVDSACPNAPSKPASIFLSHTLKGKRGAPIFSRCNLGPRSVDLASFYYSHTWRSSFRIVIHWHIVTAGDKGRRRQSNDTKHKVLTWSLFLFGCLRLLEAWIQFCCLKRELPKWLTSCWEREHWLVHHMPVFHLSVLTARTWFLQFIPRSAMDCIWEITIKPGKLDNFKLLLPFPTDPHRADLSSNTEAETCAYTVSLIHIVISSTKLEENLLRNLVIWYHEKSAGMVVWCSERGWYSKPGDTRAFQVLLIIYFARTKETVRALICK